MEMCNLHNHNSKQPHKKYLGLSSANLPGSKSSGSRWCLFSRCITKNDIYKRITPIHCIITPINRNRNASTAILKRDFMDRVKAYEVFHFCVRINVTYFRTVILVLEIHTANFWNITTQCIVRLHRNLMVKNVQVVSLSSYTFFRNDTFIPNFCLLHKTYFSIFDIHNSQRGMTRRECCTPPK